MHVYLKDLTITVSVIKTLLNTSVNFVGFQGLDESSVTTYLWPDDALRRPPANCSKLFTEVGVIDSHGTGASGVPVNGPNAALGILEVDLEPNGELPILAVMGFGHGKWSAG